jgi:hypothetical protein
LPLSRADRSKDVQRPLRVLLGPVNIAGFVGEYARGLCEIGHEATVFCLDAPAQGYGCDVDLQLGRRSLPARVARSVRWLASALPRYDVFHFDYGMTILPRHVDLPLLKAAGKRVVVQFMGSEIRCRRYELGDYANPNITCLSCRAGKCVGPDRERNVRTLARWADYFLSIPDMSFGALLPASRVFTDFRYLQAIDVMDWRPDPQWRPNEIPLIVHAPSNAEVKGTRFVIAAVERLRAAGLRFEFVLLQNVTNQVVRQVLGGCDIVVDQLLLPTNGRFAIEAMALGKPVLSTVLDEHVAGDWPSPIIRSSPQTIEADLRRLICDPQLRLDHGRRGRQYVEHFADRRQVARRLANLYRTPRHALGGTEWLQLP